MENNAEQLYKDNVSLVYYILNKLNLKHNEDCAALGLLALWKAASTYNQEASKFSTYAYVCIKNEIFVYLRRNKKFDLQETRLADLPEDLLPEDDSAIDVFAHTENIQDEVEFKLSMQNFREHLTEREKVVFDLLCEEASQREIGRRLKLSQPHISRIRKRLKYKYTRFINGLDFF